MQQAQLSVAPVVVYMPCYNFQMKKLTLFILLLVILGTCGLTFYLMYTNQSHSNSNSNETTETLPNIDLVATSTAINLDKRVNSIETNWQEIVINRFALGDNLPEIVYEGSHYVWFKEAHLKDGCNQLSYLDKKTGQHQLSSITACGGYEFEKTKPLYLVYCSEGIINCFDFRTLYAQNLEIGERIKVFDDKALSHEETYVHSCYEGNYEQICHPALSIDNRVLTVGVFKKGYTPQQWDEGDFSETQPIEFENVKVREITIDLSQFY